MTIYHEHHIIPKHMGGTDDPSNIILLSIEEHAEAHKVLYEKYGKQEDKIAWQGLSGLVSKSELMTDLYKLGRQKTDQIIFKKYGVSNPGQIEKNRILISERNRIFHAEGKMCSPDWTGKNHKPESIEKQKQTFKEIKHQQGSKNSQYGTCWITNGSENKKIKKEELYFWEEKGYHKGRIAGVV